MEYKITKEHCAKKISGVCSQCGGKVEPLETVDNAGDPTYWNGCNKCQKFDNGVEPELYEIARRMVTERNFRYNNYIIDKENDSVEKKQYNLECQISSACGVVRDVLFYYKSPEYLKRKAKVLEDYSIEMEKWNINYW